MDKALTIRAATTGDVPAIVRCARVAYQKYVERIGRPPAPMIANFAESVERGTIWVFADHDQVFGYVVCYATDRYMHLENVAVLPEHQGKGIGGELIAYVETLALRGGLRGVELYTNEKMTENQSLYPTLGYQERGRAEEAGFHRIYYRKEFFRS